jgi:hypothetical protein
VKNEREIAILLDTPGLEITGRKAQAMKKGVLSLWT